jgi:hypothetical protein
MNTGPPLLLSRDKGHIARLTSEDPALCHLPTYVSIMVITPSLFLPQRIHSTQAST